jgi:hypothetical protein
MKQGLELVIQALYLEENAKFLMFIRSKTTNFAQF